MKSLLKSAMRFTQKSFGPIHTISTAVGLFLWSIIFTAIFFTSCQKPANEIAGPSVTGNAKLVSTDNANASEVMNMYSGLSSKTAGPEVTPFRKVSFYRNKIYRIRYNEPKPLYITLSGLFKFNFFCSIIITSLRI